MTFTRSTFLLFFLLVLAVYWLLRKPRAQNTWLLLVSLVFYAWFDWKNALVMLALAAADFVIARAIAPGSAGGQARRGWLFALSLLLNLGALALFRYLNLFNLMAQRLAGLLGGLGWQVQLPLLSLALPVGISFITFKKLSYILDVSRGRIQPCGDPVAYGLYVFFFPQVQAGPIDRAGSLLPQLQAPRRWQWGLAGGALPLLLLGLFKKIVIADSLIPLVNRIFALSHPSQVLVLSAALGFTLQVLADFSAYTDLSRALALLLGLHTPENFRQPYLAHSPTEFWNRWHITLSTWLRDYIFFPLRRRLLRPPYLSRPWLGLLLPPMAAMLASGIWHGAGWTYLLWGALHGLWIVAYQALGLGGVWRPGGFLRRSLAWLAAFAFIVFSWALFRSISLEWFLRLLFQAPFSRGLADWAVALGNFTTVAFYALPLWLKMLADRFSQRLAWLQPAWYAGAAALLVLYSGAPASDFIYFRF